MKIIKKRNVMVLLLFIVTQFTYAQEHLGTNKNNSILKENQLSPSEKASAIKQYKGKFKTWKEQLDVAKDGGYKDILKKNNLILKSYTIVDKHFEILPDAKFVVSNNDNTISIINSKKGTKETSSQEALKERIINFFRTEDQDLRYITLTWINDGVSFNTNCVISQKFDCIVYDPILSNIYIF
jgi:hypothetical protein